MRATTGRTSGLLTLASLAYKFFVQFTFYATLYCAIVLGSTAYVLSMQASANLYLDGFIIGMVALSAFFGLFTFSLMATTVRFILINLTNVDVIRHKSRVYQLAIRIPRGSPPTAQYGIITYPLPRPGPNPAVAEGPQTPRDSMATRTFAVVKTDMGENLWHLGYYGNWVSVMGTNLFDWLLPIRDSPCCHEEDSKGFYRVGPLYETLRRRYNLPELPPSERGIEMTEVGRAGT
jgi:palmitoyltransferase